MSKTVQDHAALLAKLPKDLKWERVLVLTEFGEKKFKEPAELAGSDVIQVKADGTPIVMKRPPGRKKAVQITPANAVVAKLMAMKQEALEEDTILNVAKDSPDSPDVLHQIILGLGEEVANLAFVRAEMERGAKLKETPQVSAKRIQGLKAMAETWLKRRDQMVARGIDMDSPGFRAVFTFVLETMKEAMASSSLRPEMIETVFAKFSALTSDDRWENEAKNRIKKATE